MLNIITMEIFPCAYVCVCHGPTSWRWQVHIACNSVVLVAPNASQFTP